MSVVTTSPGFFARQIGEMTHPDPVVRLRKWAEEFSQGQSYCPIAKAAMEVILELEGYRNGTKTGNPYHDG